MLEMQAPPDNAAILFDGGELTNWKKLDGSPAVWQVTDGVMTCTEGSIISDETFTDAYVHVEFRVPDTEGTGNSGVYMQGRYEIQVIADDVPDLPGLKACGGIYNQHAPLVKADRPRMAWQSFDIVFRAPRVDEAGEVLEQARITAFQNGMLIHNNVSIEGPTGGHMDENEAEPGPLLLQDHGRQPVSYRNIWMVHLPEEGSEDYEPK